MLPNAFKTVPKYHAGDCKRRLLFKNALVILLIIQVLLIAFLPICSHSSARAEDVNEILNDPNMPWHIVADQLSYDDQAKVYIAEGDVEITKADKKITADHIRFDHENMQVEASGNIVVTSGEDRIAADSLVFDLDKEQGQLSNSRVYLKRNNFYIWTSELEKTGAETYEAERASVTTCEGEKPDWKITGRDLNVTIEGYGYVYHAAFWVKDIPIFYSPWIGFPVKTKRQTGLLTPLAGVSNRKGYEYSQPFFWAINDSSDATLYWHAMTERGHKIGIEYRYALTPFSKGTTIFDYLEDRCIDTATGDETSDSKCGYNEEGDNIPRTNSERYWFRTKNNQELPGNFNALLDLDIVSDQDYLTEFKRGHTGFLETRRYYNKTFGRDLDEFNDSVRLNRFNINRSWSRFNLNAEVRWYDDVVARTQDDIDDTTVQRLPFIGFTGSKQAAWKTPFLYDLDTSYAHLYREDAPTSTKYNGVTQSHRFDIHPRLYLPLSLGHYLNVEPSLGLRETVWRTQASDTTSQDSDVDDFQHRELYDVGLDLSSEIYRIFKTGQNRLKHTVTPRVNYSYIPDVDQTAYPRFDSIDRIATENEVTYSFTNLFVLRRPELREMEQQGDEPAYRYHQVARFDIGQSYDFIEAREGDSPEPFSPIAARLDITPERYFKLSATADWSVYDNELVSHNIFTRLSDRRGDSLALAHQFTRETDSDSQDGIEYSIYFR